MSGRGVTQEELERRYMQVRGRQFDPNRPLADAFGPFESWLLRLGQHELFLNPLDGGWYHHDRTTDMVEHSGYRVGMVTFSLDGGELKATPRQTEEQKDSGEATLLVLAGPRAREQLTLGAETTIGRLEGNQIVLPDDQVSRRHAVIRCQGDTYLIEDLGSRNGTYVNGVRIGTAQPLHDGDLITIGATQMAFHD